jgi:peroxiredoxin
LVADVREHLRTARPDARNLSVAFQTALAAERAGLTKLAAEAFRDFAAVFAKSDDPAVAENAKKLSGAARLLSLPGNPLELTGKQLDGEPFDLKRYAGKTVLIVFGASWNGSFVAEVPIVKEAYAKYHDRGFEVVLVSLDDDRRRLEDFVKREQLTWPVLYGDEPNAVGWNNPTAAEYGIMSVPRAILVAKDGKVVSIEAHGEALWDFLFRQIGPAVVQEPPPAAEPADKSPVAEPKP